jgi:hypothetical protein
MIIKLNNAGRNPFKGLLSVMAVFLALASLAPEEAGAFGSRPATPPAPTPKPPTTPPKPPTVPTTPTVPPTVPELPADYDVFGEVSAAVGDQVDDQYSTYRELLAVRKNDGVASNTCVGALTDRSTFSDQIAYAVFLNSQSRVSELSYLGGAYSLPTSQSGFLPASLVSNPLCPVTAASLAATIKGRTIPSAATIAKANTFSQNVNALRTKAIGGDRQSLVDLNKLWSKFMMCLSYQESLTTADATSSYNAAKSAGVASKPEGVKYYLDPLQSAESRLNIGLFQFTPASGGNIQACIRAWNKKFPSCAIKTNETLANMTKIMGASRQTFNAFCGVTKVADMFSVQVNTRAPASVHPNNVSGSTILPGPNRCVTPFFHSNKSYNHFGPLQNTIHNNLDGLLTCVNSN